VPAGDDPGGLVFLYDPEPDDDQSPMTQHEARVEVDPTVEDFARSPYDPLFAARMLGSSLGHVAEQPPRTGGFAIWAFGLGMALLLVLVLLVFSVIDRLLSAIPLATGVVDLLSAVLAIPFGIAGFLIVWRLLMRRESP
jgi:hypothetical protein